MEKRTHILFTITWIYWLSLLFRYLWLNSWFFYVYISLVASFPLITIPFQSIVTLLPDTDLPNNRLKQTVLAPAVWIILLFAKHRWFTHRFEWIFLYWLILYWLYLLWTNIIIVWIISFLAITIIWVLIDDFKITLLWIKIKKIWIWNFSIPVDKKIIDKIFSLIILLFFPVLLDAKTYTFFLIWLFFSYVFHMIWDAFSREWWTIIEFPHFISKKLFFKKIKFQLPEILSFKVWWWIERKLITPILWICLLSILILDRDFWIQKSLEDIHLSLYQTSEIINNPELLINDLNSIKIKLNNLLWFVRSFLNNV